MNRYRNELWVFFLHIWFFCGFEDCICSLIGGAGTLSLCTQSSECMKSEFAPCQARPQNWILNDMPRLCLIEILENVTDSSSGFAGCFLVMSFFFPFFLLLLSCLQLPLKLWSKQTLCKRFFQFPFIGCEGDTEAASCLQSNMEHFSSQLLLQAPLCLPCLALSSARRTMPLAMKRPVLWSRKNGREGNKIPFLKLCWMALEIQWGSLDLRSLMIERASLKWAPFSGSHVYPWDSPIVGTGGEAEELGRASVLWDRKLAKIFNTSWGWGFWKI